MKKVFAVILLTLALSVSAYAESYVVKRGDTLSGILSDRYSAQDITDISKQIKKVYPKFVLKAGMKLFRDKNKITVSVALDKNLVISTDENSVHTVTLNVFEQEMMNVLVKGEIKSNLFDAVKRAGEDAELAAMLAGIFEWEIDFFKDLRAGDRFAVLVEKKFVNDKYAGYGRVIAADFYNQGRQKRAIYFEDGKTRGYYTEEGRGLERGFLRVPMNYARVTSRFSDSRLHPVLNEYKPHYGVDYAAPRGTPVMVTASGTIDTMSFTKANGNYIAVRHSNGYKTYYLHLNGFNKALRAGSAVTQGQIIGYVGSTGYSTGPHLDYRISKNSKWLNPLTFVATPKTLKKDEKEKFAIVADAPVRVLDRAFPVYAQTQTINGLYMMEF